jgi:hypothetical protein
MCLKSGCPASGEHGLKMGKGYVVLNPHALANIKGRALKKGTFSCKYVNVLGFTFSVTRYPCAYSLRFGPKRWRQIFLVSTSFLVNVA